MVHILQQNSAIKITIKQCLIAWEALSHSESWSKMEIVALSITLHMNKNSCGLLLVYNTREK